MSTQQDNQKQILDLLSRVKLTPELMTKLTELLKPEFDNNLLVVLYGLRTAMNEAFNNKEFDYKVDGMFTDHKRVISFKLPDNTIVDCTIDPVTDTIDVIRFDSSVSLSSFILTKYQWKPKDGLNHTENGTELIISFLDTFVERILPTLNTPVETIKFIDSIYILCKNSKLLDQEVLCQFLYKLNKMGTTRLLSLIELYEPNDDDEEPTGSEIELGLHPQQGEDESIEYTNLNDQFRRISDFFREKRKRGHKRNRFTDVGENLWVPVEDDTTHNVEEVSPLPSSTPNSEDVVLDNPELSDEDIEALISNPDDLITHEKAVDILEELNHGRFEKLMEKYYPIVKDILVNDDIYIRSSTFVPYLKDIPSEPSYKVENECEVSHDSFISFITQLVVTNVMSVGIENEKNVNVENLINQFIYESASVCWDYRLLDNDASAFMVTKDWVSRLDLRDKMLQYLYSFMDVEQYSNPNYLPPSLFDLISSKQVHDLPYREVLNQYGLGNQLQQGLNISNASNGVYGSVFIYFDTLTRIDAEYFALIVTVTDEGVIISTGTLITQNDIRVFTGASRVQYLSMNSWVNSLNTIFNVMNHLKENNQIMGETPETNNITSDD